MDDSIKDGDLVFTKNVNVNDLKVNDIIAFRNYMNTITIHKILEINEKKMFSKEGEEIDFKTFTMNTLKNETNDNQYVTQDNVEGLVVKRIPKIGVILYIIQKPAVMFAIGIIIISVGLICIYIAQKLDENEYKKNK